MLRSSNNFGSTKHSNNAGELTALLRAGALRKKACVKKAPVGVVWVRMRSQRVG